MCSRRGFDQRRRRQPARHQFFEQGAEEFIKQGPFPLYPGNLGVAGVQRADNLALLMKGRVMVESRPGQGSTFKVELPLTVPAATVVH